MKFHTWLLLWAMLCCLHKPVLADYECLCSSTTSTKVHMQPFEFSNLLGTLILNECKPTFPIGSNGQWRTIQLHGQVGYVLNTQGRVVTCHGTLPSGDLVHTPSPLKVPTTSQTRTTMKSAALLPPVHGNIQLCPTNVVQKSNITRIYQNGRFCYEISDRPETWFTARDDCKNKGGTLVVILNESQQHFLQKMMSSINVHMDVWIGLSAQPKSDYIWVSGENVTYSNWFPDGFADSWHGFEDCILFTGAQHGHTGMWADVQCNGIFPFRADPRYYWICQYNTTSSAGR